MKQALKNVEDLEKYLNKNNIQFPKEWKKKLTIKKRKTRDDSEWKDFRMCYYAISRVVEISNFIFNEEIKNTKKILERILKIQKSNKQNLKKSDELNKIILLMKDRVYNLEKHINNPEWKTIYKKGGKLYYKFEYKKELLSLLKFFQIKKSALNLKLPTKKKTIIKTMGDTQYWESRYIYLGLPIEDKDNKSIFRKEAQQYFKSVCNYIVKEENKYNMKFFQKHQKPFAEMWTKNWELYKRVR